MLDLKRSRVTVAITMVLITAGAQASQDRYPATRDAQGSLAARIQAPSPPPQPLYETREIHDPNGTGKFYLGREIAQVMGPGGIAWLDRPERGDEERPAAVIDALGLRGGEVVADLGAGSGYFTFRIAPKVGKTGRVLAVEIQDEMLETIRRRATAMKVTNVEEVKGSETDPKLPVNGVDIVLMVDVYHELVYPYEVMTKVRKGLKPGGRVVFVEYRKEDPRVAIKEVHKMSVEQLEKEMRVVGLAHLRTVETLPSQHIVIFEKRDGLDARLNPGGRGLQGRSYGQCFRDRGFLSMPKAHVNHRTIYGGPPAREPWLKRKRNARIRLATAWWRRARNIAATTATTRPAPWRSHATAITLDAKPRLPQPEHECRLSPGTPPGPTNGTGSSMAKCRRRRFEASERW